MTFNYFFYSRNVQREKFSLKPWVMSAGITSTNQREEQGPSAAWEAKPRANTDSGVLKYNFEELLFYVTPPHLFIYLTVTSYFAESD